MKKLQLLATVALAVSVFSCSGGYRGGNAGYTRVGECCYPAENICCSDPDGLVAVSRMTPKEAPLNREFTVQLQVQASDDCTGVTVKEMMPEGLTYVSSNPPAKQAGNDLTWEFDKMCCRERQCIDVTYRATEEGCLKSCYSITAAPVCCQSIMVGCPKLLITKCGPECVRLGCPVDYQVTVTNCGSQVARDVELVDIVPPELRHSSCRDKLCWKLGTICPGESKCIPICFDSIKCGRTMNTATVQACNCPPVTDTFTTMIESCCIKLTKTGPEGPIQIGKDVTYKITAHNEGNIALTNVRIVDTVPSGARIKKAEGAEIHGNIATWKFARFEAEETKTFNLTMSSCTTGCQCNQVHVCCAQECGDCAQACTLFTGLPDITVCAEDQGPVCVNNMTEYKVYIKNKGSAEDTNVKVRVMFPDEMQPIECSHHLDYKIDGRKVTFDTIKTLRPGQTVTLIIKAKAVETGDARVKFQIASDSLDKPVTTEDSTQVY